MAIPLNPLVCAAGFGEQGRENRTARMALMSIRTPLPYGCGSVGDNICGLVRSDPARDSRTPLPRACLSARLDGTVCTVAADDFKTYRLSGAGAACDQDQARTREYLHAQATGDQDCQRVGDQLSPVLGREFRQAGRSCETNQKRGGQR